MVATKRRHRGIGPTHTFDFGAHASRLLLSATLALVIFTLCLLADATGAVPSPLSPLHAVHVHARPQDTPTETATTAPTNTVAVSPPSISLVSPSSGRGPVGAHITVQGSNFTGSSAQLFGSSQPDCSSSTGILTTVGVSGGSIGTTFIWPVSFSVGTYYICTTGMASSTAVYQVLTSLPPTLSLSTLSIQMGQQLTIQGSDFAGLAAGATVSLTETALPANGASPEKLPVNGVVDNNGNFSATWTVSGPYTGNVTIRAYSGSEGSSPAVLQASAAVTIQATATATVTVAVTPSVVATTASGGPGTTSTQQPDGSNKSIGLIILLITGIILSMLVIVGIVVYLTIRRRGPESDPGSAPGYDAYGGYGGYGSGLETTQAPQYGQFSAMDQHSGPAAGGHVSQWDDPDSQPGPGWQPRPMSGYYPDYDSTQAPVNSTLSGLGRPQPGPVDPWNNPSASYGTYPGGANQANQANQWRGGHPGPDPSSGATSPGWNEEDSPYPENEEWPDLYGNTDNSGNTRGW